MTTNLFPLIYKTAKFGTQIRFRKISEYRYESEHGQIINTGKLRSNYNFVMNEKTKEVYETNINGFRVRGKR